VVAALGKQIRRLPSTMMATLTWDRGPEMAAHKKFTVATDVAVYFCDPKSPWQRGTSENTNRLLRQYLPRKTDLSVYDQADLDLIALKLNTRPRKVLCLEDNLWGTRRYLRRLLRRPAAPETLPPIERRSISTPGTSARKSLRGVGGDQTR
jgi:hypothetical protein